MKLINFIKGLLPRIDKDTILEDLRVTTTELEQVAIPNYNTAAEYFRTTKFKSDANKNLSDDFYRRFSGGNKQSTFIGDVSRSLPAVKENAVYIQKQIEELMEKDILNEGLTAKKAILVRSAEHLSFISRFSIDLLNAAYINEASEVDADVRESMRMSPAAVKHVDVNTGNFAALLAIYSVPNKAFEKSFIGVPDILLSSRTANSIIGLYKEADVDPFSIGYVAGFTASPIYHIRLMIAEWQAARYKANKDKKKVLELRLLHLRLLNEKKNDAKLEQEINYIQNRVDKIEHNLREVEASLDNGA